MQGRVNCPSKMGLCEPAWQTTSRALKVGSWLSRCRQRRAAASGWLRRGVLLLTAAMTVAFFLRWL
jgi:hypothetical protein